MRMSTGKMHTEHKWNHVSNRFETAWNFRNCADAIDGKHVLIQAPANSGAMYFNYKGTFSMILMAVVHADYIFVAVDISSYGSTCDSPFGKAMDIGNLHLPPPKILPGADHLGSLPLIFVGDEAFPLKPNLLRPYPGKQLPEDRRIFNYRLPRARRISENAFGLLVQRWRIYQRRLQVEPDNAVIIIKATCMIHNYLHTNNPFINNAHTDLDGLAPRIAIDNDAKGIHCIRHFDGNRSKAEATRIMDTFKEYFSSQAGDVPWQYDIVRGVCPAN